MAAVGKSSQPKAQPACGELPTWLPEPAEPEDLELYANPDCLTCQGTGWAASQPCPVCIVGVWG